MCGLTHLVMPFAPYNENVRDFFLYICCAVSFLTAISITLVLPLVIDITDKLELTEEGILKSIQSKYIEVIECCQESIIVMSSDWQIVSSNISTESFFGPNCEGCNFLSFVHEDDKTKFRHGVANLLRSIREQTVSITDNAEWTASKVDIESALSTDHFTPCTAVKSDSNKKTLILEYRATNRKGGWNWIESTLIISVKPKHNQSQTEKGPWKVLNRLFQDSRIAPRDELKNCRYSTQSHAEDTDNFQIMMLSRNVTTKKQNEFVRDQKLKQQQIEKVNTAKLKYITSCAHDLKTPLQSFNFAIELLAASSLTPDQIDILNQARVSALLMSLTISQTMDTSKVLVGEQLVPRKGTVLLSEILSRVGIVIESYSRQVPIIFHLGVGIRNRVITDEEWLWQMILNYLTNACKFTERGSIEVWLDLESELPDHSFLRKDERKKDVSNSTNHRADSGLDQRLEHMSNSSRVNSSHEGSKPSSIRTILPYSDDYLVFQIIDSGVGVSEKHQKTLFDLFSQAQNGQTTGTGVGLYGVKIRSEGLNGSCGMVARQSPDQGSVFWFKIPYLPDTSNYIELEHDPTEFVADISNFKASRVFRNICVLQDNPQCILRLEIPRLCIDNKLGGCGSVFTSPFGSHLVSGGASPLLGSRSNSITGLPVGRQLELELKESQNETAKRLDTDPIKGAIKGAIKDPMKERNARGNVSESIQNDSPLTAAIRAKNMTAFVVDDVQSIRKLMRHTLLNMGFASVKLFENGSAALEAMKIEQVDVVFMDIQMPIMSGPEVRTSHQFHYPLILMLFIYRRLNDFVNLKPHESERVAKQRLQDNLLLLHPQTLPTKIVPL